MSSAHADAGAMGLVIAGQHTCNAPAASPHSVAAAVSSGPPNGQWTLLSESGALVACWSASAGAYVGCAKPVGGTGEANEARPITTSDLAAFTPEAGELVVEPDDWAVVGSPTNMYATAAVHVQSGELLGEVVDVRWTPVAFTFDYGDGATQRTTSPGTAWRDASEHFTDTATSHTYRDRGDVTASVTVTFAAEIRLGSAWTPVEGTVVASPAPVHVSVFEVDTALVRGDCANYPDDPGCP